MSKKRGKHTTIIDGLDRFLKQLLKICQADYACGFITAGLPSANHLIKIKQLSGGVALIYRSTCSKQILYLYGRGELIEKAVCQTAQKLAIKVKK